MTRLKVGLFGFGRTGQLVAREILADPELELAWVVRRKQGTSAQATAADLPSPVPIVALPNFDSTAPPSVVDVLIDFSGAAAVHAYEAVAALGTRVVSAVSRYEADGLAALRRMADRTAVLHSANITVGINFVLAASRAMRRLAPEADIAILEEHFREKPEVSGTALRLAEALGLPSSSGVHSIRAGGIVGRHEVVFGLPNQTVRLVHESISRAAFGRGAIFAAKWLAGRELGLYTMEDAVKAQLAQAILDA